MKALITRVVYFVLFVMVTLMRMTCIATHGSVPCRLMAAAIDWFLHEEDKHNGSCLIRSKPAERHITSFTSPYMVCNWARIPAGNALSARICSNHPSGR